MKAIEIESRVFELEEVRIVIRACAGEDLGDYNYDRKASSGTSVSAWIENRLRPILDGFDVVVVGGGGSIPHGRTLMSTLRGSYS